MVHEAEVGRSVLAQLHHVRSRRGAATFPRAGWSILRLCDPERAEDRRGVAS